METHITIKFYRAVEKDDQRGEREPLEKTLARIQEKDGERKTFPQGDYKYQLYYFKKNKNLFEGELIRIDETHKPGDYVNKKIHKFPGENCTYTIVFVYDADIRLLAIQDNFMNAGYSSGKKLENFVNFFGGVNYIFRPILNDTALEKLEEKDIRRVEIKIDRDTVGEFRYLDITQMTQDYNAGKIALVITSERKKNLDDSIKDQIKKWLKIEGVEKLNVKLEDEDDEISLLTDKYLLKSKEKIKNLSDDPIESRNKRLELIKKIAQEYRHTYKL